MSVYPLYLPAIFSLVILAGSYLITFTLEQGAVNDRIERMRLVTINMTDESVATIQTINPEIIQSVIGDIETNKYSESDIENIASYNKMQVTVENKTNLFLIDDILKMTRIFELLIIFVIFVFVEIVFFIMNTTLKAELKKFIGEFMDMRIETEAPEDSASSDK